jgi:hypothetical protein
VASCYTSWERNGTGNVLGRLFAPSQGLRDRRSSPRGPSRSKKQAWATTLQGGFPWSEGGVRPKVTVFLMAENRALISIYGDESLASRPQYIAIFGEVQH